MKKIILLFILAILPFFAIESNLYALTYGGSANYSIPGVYDMTGTLIYGVSAPVSGGVGASPLFDVQFTPSTRMVSWTYGIRFQSGAIGAYSGLVSQISQTSCGDGGGFGCYWYNWLHIDLMASTGATSTSYYIKIQKYNHSAGDNFVVDVATIPQFTLDNNITCPGQTSDCILIIQPRMYYKSSGASQGAYLAYIDYTWYYGADKKTQYFRAYFGDLTENGPAPTTWQSVLSWLGLGVTGYGLYTGWDRGFSSSNDYGHYWGALSLGVATMPYTSGIGYYRTASANPNDDTILRDYFVGNTGSVETTFPAWVGSSGLKVSIISSDGTISDPSSGGSGSTSGSVFSSCSTLDIGCYFGNSIQYIADAPSRWLSSIIPDINFNGFSSTCLTGSGNLSATGSITSLPFMQKLVNIFALAVPIAPSQDSQVCTINGDVKTVHYGRTSPTVVDWLIILSCIVPIFFTAYHKPNTSS